MGSIYPRLNDYNFDLPPSYNEATGQQDSLNRRGINSFLSHVRGVYDQNVLPFSQRPPLRATTNCSYQPLDESDSVAKTVYSVAKQIIVSSVNVFITVLKSLQSLISFVFKAMVFCFSIPIYIAFYLSQALMFSVLIVACIALFVLGWAALVSGVYILTRSIIELGFSMFNPSAKLL